ncbi:PBECR3 domain-containing polyvalent protein [Tepidibacter sp. Z1-5]|uniref:PBECR3 domain-containing polyvalent protein n=1 Tax=Tepidibacter sp. Z1-5 TaxID=3134138 RepID=UPI0030C0A3A4
MTSDFSKYIVVGFIDETISTLANCNYIGQVYAAPGVIKHIKKRHNHELNESILNDIIDTIKKVLNEPEYIGTHPKKIGTSIEFIKEIDNNILVATELDIKENYIYVASMYPIHQSKIDNRIHSGRLKKL